MCCNIAPHSSENHKCTYTGTFFYIYRAKEREGESEREPSELKSANLKESHMFSVCAKVQTKFNKRSAFGEENGMNRYEPAQNNLVFRLPSSTGLPILKSSSTHFPNI